MSKRRVPDKTVQTATLDGVERAKTYTSAFSRLWKLAEYGPFFEGKLAMGLFGWNSRTVTHYMGTWTQHRYIKPLGGHSDIYFNLFVDANSERFLQEAITRVMPGATIGAHNVLYAGGVIKQRPGLLHLLTHPDSRKVPTDLSIVESRPAGWWMHINAAGGVEPGNDKSLARLKPGAAIADAAVMASIKPNDIIFGALNQDDQRLAYQVLAAMAPSIADHDLETAYRYAFGRAHNMNASESATPAHSPRRRIPRPR